MTSRELDAEKGEWGVFQAELDRLRKIEQDQREGKWRPVFKGQGGEFVEKPEFRRVGEASDLGFLIKAWKKRIGFSGIEDVSTYYEAVRTALGEDFFKTASLIEFRQGWLSVGVWNQAKLSEIKQFYLNDFNKRIKEVFLQQHPNQTFRGLRLKSIRKPQ